MSDNEPAQHSPNYGGWASFEVEIRARRYARCLQAAQLAVDAGKIDEAREWIAEGRLVSFAAIELDELERYISTRSDSATAPAESAKADLLSAREERKPELEPELVLADEPEDITDELEDLTEEEAPVLLAPVVPREHVLTRVEPLVTEDQVLMGPDVFRRPDPGLESPGRDVLRPGDGVLFGSIEIEERREVGWATVLFGMATAALLVGATSFGVARFMNGQPLDRWFQISRDEHSASVDPQPAPQAASQPSTPPSTPPEAPALKSEAKQPDVAVTPPAPAEPRADVSPSPGPAPATRREPAASESASPAPDSARPRPPAIARGTADVETAKPGAAVRQSPTASLPPPRAPLSGGRLVLPPSTSSVRPEAAPVRPFEPPAAMPTAAGTSGSVPAAVSAPAAAVVPPSPAPVTPAPVTPAPESPAPTPSSPAPSPRISAESRAEDTASIRGVLTRYEAAYNRLDARAAKTVWPRVNEGALDRAFGGLLSQKVALGLCDIAVIGDVAGASCTGKARWEPKIGGGVQTADRSWKFNLRKSQDGWKIEDILVR